MAFFYWLYWLFVVVFEIAMKRPNLFIVGAPKSGTTSIYNYLKNHPEVFMSPIKEPHFFAKDFIEDEFIESQQVMSDINADKAKILASDLIV